MEGLQILDPTARGLRTIVVDPLEQRRALFLPEGVAGLHRVVALEGAGSLVVLARLRAVAPNGSPPQLSVLALEMKPEGTDPRRSLLDVRRLRQARTERFGAESSARPGSELTVETDRASGQEWQVLTLLLPADPKRRAVRVSVIEGSGVLLDEVVIGRLSPAEELGLQRRRSGRVDRHPLVERVRLGDVEMDSLLLPSGTKVRFCLPVSASGPRLDAAVGRHSLARNRDVGITLAIDGEVVSSRPLNGAATGFADWNVPLSRWAGRTVTIELAATGVPGSVAVLGNPWLLAGSTPRAGPNVVLISIDTLRADAIGCYGNRETHTPAMDALARDGTCFRSATSPSSYTLPAHATMLTAQHPLTHGVTNVGTSVIDPSRSQPLAVTLRDAGWQTAAFTAGGLVHPDFGFGRGFERFGIADVCGVRSSFQESAAELSVDGTRFAASTPLFDWLGRRSDQPFFLFLHTYFVHNYVPSPEFAARHGAVHRPNLVLANGAAPDDLMARMRLVKEEAGAAAGLRKLYLAAVDEIDARLIAPLLDELDRLGIGDRTIVALVSDHGDEFQEHGALFHGRTLWNELVHVPLILRGPGIPRGAVRGDRVGLEDLVPTLAARIGVPRDERWSGRDLLSVDAEEDPESVPRLLHLDNRDPLGEYRWEGLLLHGYAMLRHRDGDGAPREYLFDMQVDPAQKVNLSSRRSAELAALGRRLDAEMEALRQEAAAAQERNVAPGGEDEELKRRLRELGYGIK